MNIIQIFRDLSSTKKSILVALFLLISGPFIGRYTGTFRFISDLRWIYHTGWILAYLFAFGALFLSIINSILLFKQSEWKTNLIWILLSLFPLLYFVIMIVDVSTMSIE